MHLSFGSYFFIAILVVEIAAMPLIFKRQKLGAELGILASILNILEVIADQAHLIQPEVAPLGYSMLEGSVVVASVALVYFAFYGESGPP